MNFLVAMACFCLPSPLEGQIDPGGSIPWSHSLGLPGLGSSSTRQNFSIQVAHSIKSNCQNYRTTKKSKWWSHELCPNLEVTLGQESVILSEFFLSCSKLIHFIILVSKSTCVLKFAFATGKVTAQNSFCLVWMTKRNLPCYCTVILLSLLHSSFSTLILFTRGSKYYTYSFKHSWHVTVVQKHCEKKTRNHIYVNFFAVAYCIKKIPQNLMNDIQYWKDTIQKFCTSLLIWF